MGNRKGRGPGVKSTPEVKQLSSLYCYEQLVMQYYRAQMFSVLVQVDPASEHVVVKHISGKILVEGSANKCWEELKGVDDDEKIVQKYFLKHENI